MILCFVVSYVFGFLVYYFGERDKFKGLRVLSLGIIRLGDILFFRLFFTSFSFLYKIFWEGGMGKIEVFRMWGISF